ncbi:MAG: tRNA (adenosine(37)-N6)-threonylcarbamoyltransferase complex transferase subunit TsaD [Anaplasmataceae bacterium]|nr:tRNA (adenosine(37)-N6)-threonylcarbamoyltransferase complex transferase subunit TsaD [Anaplasmataceae bacterium]
MIVLGIESTCDETACAIVKDGDDILSNVIASQIDLHAIYGGVFPELACRRHIDAIPEVIEKALKEAGLTLNDIDTIAVAKGPGLMGALLVGLNMAKGLSMALNIPLVGVNHVEAHLYAAMMGQQALQFPALGIVISGGHTFFTKILDIGSYEILGTTVDDAIGEAFDKVARLMGLPYPGGPAIERLALDGDPLKYPFKAGRVKGKPWHFSFSGLKTSVLYAIKGQNAEKTMQLSTEELPHLAASFQRAAFEDLVKRALKALEQFSLQAIYLGGGVSNNQTLRQMFHSFSDSLPVFWPKPPLSLDNAAMIAGLGYHQYIKKGPDHLDLLPLARIPLASW